jgi:hypothetical protein
VRQRESKSLLEALVLSPQALIARLCHRGILVSGVMLQLLSVTTSDVLDGEVRRKSCEARKAALLPSPTMKRLLGDVLAGLIVLAVGGTLISHGVGGWKLYALCALLLIVYLRPRGDAATRRHRRIERESDRVAQLITDTRDILYRAIEKIPPEQPERLPSASRCATTT